MFETKDLGFHRDPAKYGALMWKSAPSSDDESYTIPPDCGNWFNYSQQCLSQKDTCKWKGTPTKGTCENKKEMTNTDNFCLGNSVGEELWKDQCKFHHAWKALSATYSNKAVGDCHFDEATKQIVCKEQDACAGGFPHHKDFTYDWKWLKYNCTEGCDGITQPGIREELRYRCCNKCNKIRANPDDYNLGGYIVYCTGCSDLNPVPNHKTPCAWTTDEKIKIQCREADKCETGSEGKLQKTKNASCKVVPCDPACSHDKQMYSQCCATCLENACSGYNPSLRQICRGCAPGNLSIPTTTLAPTTLAPTTTPVPFDGDCTVFTFSGSTVSLTGLPTDKCCKAIYAISSQILAFDAILEPAGESWNHIMKAAGIEACTAVAFGACTEGMLNHWPEDWAWLPSDYTHVGLPNTMKLVYTYMCDNWDSGCEVSTFAGSGALAPTATRLKARITKEFVCAGPKPNPVNTPAPPTPPPPPPALGIVPAAPPPSPPSDLIDDNNLGGDESYPPEWGPCIKHDDFHSCIEWKYYGEQTGWEIAKTAGGNDAGGNNAGGDYGGGNATLDRLYHANAAETEDVQKTVAGAIASALPAWLLPISGVVLAAVGAFSMGRRVTRSSRAITSRGYLEVVDIEDGEEVDGTQGVPQRWKNLEVIDIEDGEEVDGTQGIVETQE